MLASNWLRACGESVNPGQHLVGLNDAQRAAAEHGRGPLLVIAGAGSGKTNTLAHRVANLVVHGADPRRILLLTFSRRAASEMARRVERIVAAAVALENPAPLRPMVHSIRLGLGFCVTTRATSGLIPRSRSMTARIRPT